MYACMTPVGFDTSDKFENYCFIGSGGMLYRKIFENLRTVMAILVHLEQFSGKLYCNFLPLVLSASLESIDTYGVLQTGFYICRHRAGGRAVN